MADLEGLVLVACSGGPDSLALAAATAFEARHATRWGAGAVVVDHGLQEGSAAAADAAAAQCRTLGLAPVEVRTLALNPGPNTEARAREARYGALSEAAHQHGARAVLLGHTMDDQAETVLLALGRGSGTAALAGMPPARGLFLRPFLTLRREHTEAACQAQQLTPHHDPTNTPGGPHPSRRAEVRAHLIPAMEQILGPGIIPALARTAEAIRTDSDLLDAQAAQAFADAKETHADRADPDLEAQATQAPADPNQPDARAAIVLSCEKLTRLPRAIRRRVLYQAALAWGADPSALTSTHVDALEALVTEWRGQGAVALPGCPWVARECGKLSTTPQT